ncbi:MAG: hypothetical protein REI45_00275 [Propionicimonas sp.]|nr:hypothetical protein [Propionicimonas sp.]
MPTFDDPRKDADEAFQALRGLAHASRAFTDPADTYPVIGDLLGGVRSLRQVVDQLAAAHITHRGRAHDDAGNQTAGATSALAAADELHQAGTLLDAVEERLNAASQHSGRIAWHPAEPASIDLPGPERTVAQAGTLTLTVWPDTPLGEHQRYGYRVEDTTTGEAVEGRDLFTGAGAPVAPDKAVRELAVFLSAAGEARQYALDNPGTSPENEGLFPERIADAAMVNADALSELAEHGTQPPDAAESVTGRRWIGVVFLDGSEGDKMLDLIHASGTDAAIEHLAGYDYGEDTVQDALANGYVYDAPPRGALDKMATKDVYALTYSPFLGHVSLLREYDAAPDPALLGIDTPEPAARRGEREPARARREATDWFARRPGAAAASSRGLAL